MLFLVLVNQKYVVLGEDIETLSPDTLREIRYRLTNMEILRANDAEKSENALKNLQAQYSADMVAMKGELDLVKRENRRLASNLDLLMRKIRKTEKKDKLRFNAKHNAKQFHLEDTAISSSGSKRQLRSRAAEQGI